MKALVFSLLALSHLSASVMEITVEGTFERADNRGPLALDFPVPFFFHAQFDREVGGDREESPLEAELYSELPVALDVGAGPDGQDYHLANVGTDVYLYAGYGGVYGVAATNTWPFEAYGIQWPAHSLYFGAFSPFLRDLFPTDDLSLIATADGNPRVENAAYLLWTNSPLGDISVQANDDLIIDVHEVPEPAPLAMLAAAAVASAGWGVSRVRRP